MFGRLRSVEYQLFQLIRHYPAGAAVNNRAVRELLLQDRVKQAVGR